jgi:hypothetical protein
MESGKKTDIYKPTDAEKRVLEVALNPECINLNIVEKCKMAKVSRDTWYKAMKKPEFINMLNTMTMDLLKGKVADLINATYNFAVTDSKCSQDRKNLLTIAGIYTDKVEMKADVNVKKLEDFFK